MSSAGYSGTPLAKKLGIKEGFQVRLINEPKNYHQLFTDFPVSATIAKDDKEPKDLIHFFTTKKKELESSLLQLRNEIKPNGSIWVSWPKKTAKVVTDVTEDVIRDLALKSSLVDVKVCAVDEVWSGLKLVIPVKERRTSG